MRVKLVDIPAQYEDIEPAILDTFTRLMRESAFTGGPDLVELETKLSAYCKVAHAIGCSSGTDALKLALLGAGIKDWMVIVPTLSFIASANAVVHAGGTPVLVDCDPHTYLLDLNEVESLVKTKRIDAIMCVHLYGNPCPMDAIMNIAERYGVTIIEDTAQALGASFLDRPVGSFGTASGVSFFPSKNLGAFGQGGAVLTNDAAVAGRVRCLGQQGAGVDKHHFVSVGYNDRLDTLQAAILNLLLPKLGSFNFGRARAAAWYKRRLPEERLQRCTVGGIHVRHILSYCCDSEKQRARLMEEFREKEIEFGLHYPVPIHKQEAYKFCNSDTLTVSERLCKTLISLPMHPNLTESEVDYVCDTIGSVG